MAEVRVRSSHLAGSYFAFPLAMLGPTLILRLVPKATKYPVELSIIHVAFTSNSAADLSFHGASIRMRRSSPTATGGDKRASFGHHLNRVRLDLWYLLSVPRRFNERITSPTSSMHAGEKHPPRALNVVGRNPSQGSTVSRKCRPLGELERSKPFPSRFESESTKL